jgi:hypothetical protein
VGDRVTSSWPDPSRHPSVIWRKVGALALPHGGDAGRDHRAQATLIKLLREMISVDRFPLSPWVKSLRAILAKLDPPAPGPEPMPPPKPSGEPSLALRRKKRR